MIVAEAKTLEEIFQLVEPFKKILVAGCGGCVTVCMAGGAKEVGLLASAIRLSRRNNQLEVLEQTVLRQCEYEFNRELSSSVSEVEAVLSLACGVGVQSLAEQNPDKPVLPGLNTKFMGLPLEQGVWAERCQGCGECVLDKTFGICPITRCSKSLLNGPCGGSQGGKCEIDPDVPCAWQLIYDKAISLGQVDRLRHIQPVKDWSKSRDGGPRKVVRGDVRLDEIGQ